MELTEELSKVKNIIHAILKAKKISRMYPNNNPIYIKTMKDVSDRFDGFFRHKDDLQLIFGKNDISCNSENVYHSTEKHDNLALLFFKDGLRELTFKKGLSPEEVEEFIRIISMDFEREATEDDIVTLFWERDFEKIKYVVEDAFLVDEQDYENKAMKELKEKASVPDVNRAYNDLVQKNDEVEDIPVLPLTDGDFKSFFGELEKEPPDKTWKLFNILVEMFIKADRREDYREIASYLMKAVEYSLKQGNIHPVTGTLSRLQQVIDGQSADEETKKYAGNIMRFAGNDEIICIVGDLLDSSQIQEKDFADFAAFLDETAILPLIKKLGELKAIYARRMFIEALVTLGPKDITLFVEKLNDSRWYVVRNMVHILRKIGDKKVVNSIIKTLRHEDMKVKKEVIRALGELGGDKAITALGECLHDNNIQVRKAAVTALGNTGSDLAKKIIMEQISGKYFRDKDFDEKKCYFDALAPWNDEAVYDFLVRILKKRVFWKKAKKNETKACAAYCLGLIGRRDAVPILNEYKTASHKLLRESSFSALKRIDDGI